MINIKRKAWELRTNLKGNALKYKDKVTEWQWLEPERIAVMQRSRLSSLLRHSYQHVPFYRDRLAAAGVVDADGCIHLEHFHLIPLLDKDTINGNSESLTSDDVQSRSWYRNSSGGSTGVPVQIIQDRDFSDWTIAVKMLDDEWSGFSSASRRAYVWGSVRDTLAGKETVKTYVGRWLRNELWLNSFRMTLEKKEEFIRKLNEFKPVQIMAFAENIYDLAQYIEERRLPVHSPVSVMTSAGMLYPHMRDTIERVFRAPVYNRYGSREVGDIACECGKHNGLHISSFTHFIEILRPDGSLAPPGEYGEIAVTLLTNYSMPLIRYRIGDMGVLSPEQCSCGRGLPLLKELVGRTSDMFINGRGDWIDGRMFIRLLILLPFVQKFQVIQERVDQIKILLVPFKWQPDPQAAYAEELVKLAEGIKTFMGEECEVQSDFVHQIDCSESGKYRFTISKVPR